MMPRTSDAIANPFVFCCMGTGYGTYPYSPGGGGYPGGGGWFGGGGWPGGGRAPCEGIVCDSPGDPPPPARLHMGAEVALRVVADIAGVVERDLQAGSEQHPGGDAKRS